VQLDPMKVMLKAPGTKRLKLQYDKVLSRCAFKFSLRRYNEAGLAAAAVKYASRDFIDGFGRGEVRRKRAAIAPQSMAGAYTR